MTIPEVAGKIAASAFFAVALIASGGTLYTCVYAIRLSLHKKAKGEFDEEIIESATEILLLAIVSVVALCIGGLIWQVSNGGLFLDG